MQVLASLKLSFAAMAALLLGILITYFDQSRSVLWLAVPLLVLAVNLLFAMVYNPRIRQNSGLLMFHICLLALALLSALGQLTSMNGRLEIVQGLTFDSEQLQVMKSGPWHSLQTLKQVSFTQGDFLIEYKKNLTRGRTFSQISAKGESFVVGNNTAFHDLGYRFYTTSNKGYAAILTWHGDDGLTIPGVIHFPSFPLYDWKQDNQWQTPSGELLKIEFISAIQAQPENSWQLDSRQAAGLLKIEPENGKLQTLQPNQRINLRGGELEFVQMRMWMGYSVFYNPWLVWFFATSIVGVFGLTWHYYLNMRPRTSTETSKNARLKTKEMI